MKAVIKDLIEYREHLKEKYPGGIPRCRVVEASGGIVSPKTMANLSGKGEEPSGTRRVRGKIVYPVDSFVDWLYGKEVSEDE